MPDLIRHPDVVPTKVGNQKPIKLDSCFHRKPWIPAGVYPDENRGRNDNLNGNRIREF